MKKAAAVMQGEQVIYPKVMIASNFWSRFVGLMGRRELDKDSGLLLTKCKSIHTCFMRFPIDAVYLDKQFRVLDCETIRPWRLGRMVKGTRHILEVPAGTGGRLIKAQPIILKGGDER